jgi:hypothetical protein
LPPGPRPCGLRGQDQPGGTRRTEAAERERDELQREVEEERLETHTGGTRL